MEVRIFCKVAVLMATVLALLSCASSEERANEAELTAQIAKSRAINAKGDLVNALALGSFKYSERDAFKKGAAKDHFDITTIDTRVFASYKNKKWVPITANDQGIIDFKSRGLGGKLSQSSAYLSFWLWSPIALTDAVPITVSMHYGSDDGSKIWLNQTVLQDKSSRSGGHRAKQFAIAELPLQQGWNHMVVKVTQGGGDWKFSANLDSSLPGFIRKLDSALFR